MATLRLTYDEIDENIAVLLAVERDRGDWSAEFAADIDRVRRAGLRKFYNAYDWSFLRPLVAFDLEAPYSTGTVAVAAGVVTLTGGVFPSWAVNGHLSVDGYNYPIASRDSDTQVTLEDTSVAVSSGAAYLLQQYRFELPEDFGGFDNELTYDSRRSAFRRSMRNVGELRVRKRYQHNESFSLSDPIEFGVYPDTDGQSWWLVFWPAASGAERIVGRYRANPSDISSGEPAGGEMHSQTILEAVLSEAEVKIQDQPNGPHAQLYAQRLSESVDRDRRTGSPDHLGPLSDAMGVHDTGRGYYVDSSPDGLVIPTGYEDFFN